MNSNSYQSHCDLRHEGRLAGGHEDCSSRCREDRTRNVAPDATHCRKLLRAGGHIPSASRRPPTPMAQYSPSDASASVPQTWSMPGGPAQYRLRLGLRGPGLPGPCSAAASGAEAWRGGRLSWRREACPPRAAPLSVALAHRSAKASSLSNATLVLVRLLAPPRPARPAWARNAGAAAAAVTAAASSSRGVAAATTTTGPYPLAARRCRLAAALCSAPLGQHRPGR